MILDIDFHSGVPIYRQIVRQVQRLVLAGSLSEGRQIDSVRDLAERLKVNPMTISKAYSLLETEGFLERRRGVGLFIAPLSEKLKQQHSQEILDELMGKAASAAMQMGLSQNEAAEAIKKHYEKFQVKMRS